MFFFFSFVVYAPSSLICTEVCALPLDIGICRASVPRFYYDAGAGKCEHFIYGGCQGNANNFPSLDACRNRCVKK